jgi:hypothetical protein
MSGIEVVIQDKKRHQTAYDTQGRKHMFYLKTSAPYILLPDMYAHIGVYVNGFE